MNFFGLSLIAARQLSFLNITFIFNFHSEKFLPLNFSISYIAAIAFIIIHELTALIPLVVKIEDQTVNIIEQIVAKIIEIIKLKKNME